jgi:hypothetical protein
MEERGFLSDKFGQYQPEPSPTAWARVQQLGQKSPTAYFWQKAGFSWIVALVMLSGISASAYFWPFETINTQSNSNSSKQVASFKPNSQIGFVTVQNEQAEPQIIASSDKKSEHKISKVGHAFKTPIAKPKANKSTFQVNQLALLKASNVAYVSIQTVNNQENLTQSGLVSFEKEVPEASDLNGLVQPNSLNPLLNKLAAIHFSNSENQPESLNILSGRAQKPFANYPLSVSLWGGLMMNYYNIHPAFEVRSQQLPGAISTDRIGFEFGTMIHKPISRTIDGFVMAGLGWHQYKAHLKSVGDSLIGYNQSQNQANELEFSGRFSDRHFQLNLKSLYLQFSSGLLFRNIAGPVSLRLGAGITMNRTQSETNLVSGLGRTGSSSNIGGNVFVGVPFQVNFSANRRMVLEPTFQYFFNHKVTVPGIANLQPVQVGVRIGLH